MRSIVYPAAVLATAAALYACGQPASPSAPEPSPKVPAAEEEVAAPAPAAASHAAAASEAGEPALPPVTEADAAAVRKALDAARGKVAVVNLWATWCPPCVAEMPYFTQLHKEYAEKGVEVISVSADGKAAIANAVVPFQKKQQLPFAIQVLAEPNPDALTEVFGKELSGALPETFVYDKEGKLVKSWESEVTFEELEAAVKPLL